jgi:hypothetical protein
VFEIFWRTHVKNKMILGAVTTLALGLASTSHAAVLYFSTSATAPTVGVPNVTLTADPGATVTGSLFAWVEINPQTEGIDGISLNGKSVLVSGSGSLSATNLIQNNKNSDNSTRWDFVAAPTLNSSGNLFTRSNQASIAGSSGINDSTFGVGLGGGASIADSGTGEYKLFELDYSVIAPASGSAVYNIDFTLGQQKFGFAAGGPQIGVGTASDLLTVSGASGVVGSASANPDAVITVNTTAAPEPASLGLLSAGAIALLSRRRRV